MANGPKNRKSNRRCNSRGGSHAFPGRTGGGRKQTPGASQLGRQAGSK